VGRFSSSYWGQPLLNTYWAAVRSFQEHHVGTSPPHFWELWLSFDEPVILDAVEGIAREIRLEPMAREPYATSVLLRYLLRTHLSDIRGNHLWPEVEHLLQQTSRQRLPSAKVQNFFRESLLQCHQDQLPRHKNRFVMFLLNDVGIGYGRSDWVRLFLENLLVRRRLDPISSPTAVLMDQLNQIHDPNLRALTTVLENTGRALLAISDFSRQHPDLVPAANDSWDTIRAFWLEMLRLDLDRLLPEGRHILEPMIPHRAAGRGPRTGTVRIAHARAGITLIAGVSQSGTVIVDDADTSVCIETSESLEISGDVSVASDQGQTSYRRIHLEGWPLDPVVLRTVGSQWTIMNAEAMRIVGPPEPLVWGEVAIAGRNTIPIQSTQAGLIRGALPESWDPEFLWVTLEVPDRLPVKVPFVDMQQLTAGLKGLGTGPVTFRLEYLGRIAPQRYHFYLFDSAPRIEPSTLDQPSIITWSSREGNRVRLNGGVARDPLHARVQATYAVPDDAGVLSFEWRPTIDDAHLYADGKEVGDGSVFWLGEVQREFTLAVVASSKTPSLVRLAEQPIAPEGLATALQDLLTSHPSDLIDLAYAGHTHRQWILATGPGHIRATATWSSPGEIRGTVSWIGTNASLPRITIANGLGTATQIEDQGIRGGLGFHAFQAQVQWTIEEADMISPEGMRIQVLGPMGKADLGIVLESLEHEVGTIPQRIMASLDRLDKGVSTWDVVYLVERYARLTSVFPVSVDRLVRRLSVSSQVGARGAIQALYLLDGLMKHRPMPHAQMLVEGADSYGEAFFATLVVLNQIALYRRGLGNPKILQKLVDEFARKFEDKEVGEWCRLMVEYCHSRTGIGLSDAKGSMLVASPPLVLFDPHLSAWWNNLPKKEGYHGGNS